jgi:hypothetical protein
MLFKTALSADVETAALKVRDPQRILWAHLDCSARYLSALSLLLPERTGVSCVYPGALVGEVGISTWSIQLLSPVLKCLTYQLWVSRGGRW